MAEAAGDAAGESLGLALSLDRAKVMASLRPEGRLLPSPGVSPPKMKSTRWSFSSRSTPRHGLTVLPRSPLTALSCMFHEPGQEGAALRRPRVSARTRVGGKAARGHPRRTRRLEGWRARTGTRFPARSVCFVSSREGPADLPARATHRSRPPALRVRSSRQSGCHATNRQRACIRPARANRPLPSLCSFRISSTSRRV